MQVETYECQETAAEPIEATEEAIGLIESLGLEGQRSLISPADDAPAKRCPYSEMSKEQRRVFEALCPTQVKVEEYSAGPIPLRALQVLAHAQSLGMFDKIQVWDRESSTVVDPVLIGCVKDATYSWTAKWFLLARWGEHLDEWPAMVRAAARIVHAKAKLAVTKAIVELNQKAAILDATPPEECPLDFQV